MVNYFAWICQLFFSNVECDMFVHWVCYIHIGEQGVLVLADPSANWQILSLIDPIFLRGQQCPVNNIFGHKSLYAIY
jgi:hypothetical protein